MATPKLPKSGGKGWLKKIFIISGTVLVCTTLYFSPNIYHIYQWNPVFTPLSANLYGEANSVNEARLDDLDFLKKLPDIDRSFSEEALAKFYQSIERLEQQVEELTDTEFLLGIAQAVALADNGHTGASRHGLLRGKNRLPIRFFWFGDELHIVRTTTEYKQLLGAKVLYIGDYSVNEATEISSQYFGGPSQWRRYLSTSLLESPELVNAMGISADENSLKIALETPNGVSTTQVLQALSDAQSSNLAASSWRVLSRDKLNGEDSDWVSIGDDWHDQPIRFASADQPHLFKWIADKESAYIRFDLLMSYDGHDIDHYWEKVETELKNQSLEFIILDLRNSPGGDYTTTVDHIAKLPSYLKDEGKLYVATSNATFSAAIVSTSVAKFHGQGKTVIIGERVGDRDQFWAEGGFPFKLPHSGLRISFATGFHDWVNGCTGKHPYCFSLNAEIENPIDSLDPDVELSYRFEDYKAGKNPVLEYAVSQTNQGS